MFDKLKKDMEEIAGSWNGDESGRDEDRANSALEVLESIKQIEENLDYLNELS